MKIAMVVHDFDRSFGHGRYAVEITSRLARHHEFHVFAHTFAGQPEANMTFYKVPAWKPTAIVSILSFLFPAERMVRRQPFDLIHAQGMTCWSADVITGHMCNAAKYLDLPPATLRARVFPAIITPLERRFFQQRRARHLIAISRRFESEVQTHYGWRKPSTVIYHGTDTDTFRPNANEEERLACRAFYGLKAKDWVWLFMGEAVKGLRQAIEQLPHFPDATLLVISRSNFAPFQELARNLGVDSRIRFWGFEKMPARAYRAADVFVYASNYDPFGMVVSEAMASELPCIVGLRTGVAELVAARENGLLCDPLKPETIREQLAWLRANPKRALALSRAARVTICKHSWEACARQTEAVYNQAIQKPAAK